MAGPVPIMTSDEGGTSLSPLPNPPPQAGEGEGSGGFFSSPLPLAGEGWEGEVFSSSPTAGMTTLPRRYATLSASIT